METKQWSKEMWKKIVEKVSFTSDRIGASFPHIAKDNKQYDNHNDNWWTNGFWPGILWHIYRVEGVDKFREIAEEVEAKLDSALYNFEKLYHDIGFMWSLSSVANYKVTGNKDSRLRALNAASHLAGRFNLKGNFIRAWNGDGEIVGYAIIDCMMNLPILYWASEEIGDPRFKHIAMAHADMAMREFVRPDGSVNHIVVFDPETGEVTGGKGGQGYELGSSWSRGQAWGLYGFVLSYLYTKKQEYLDTAKKIAHYFIANLGDDGVPLCDFRAPLEPVIIDTTAGMIAACGLLELADITCMGECRMFHDSAVKILKSTVEKHGDWTKECEGIIKNGSFSYNDKIRHIPIIYGDYYFVEAIAKLNGKKELFW